jgi:uncharacterized membrane protein (DUF485 family)
LFAYLVCKFTNFIPPTIPVAAIWLLESPQAAALVATHNSDNIRKKNQYNRVAYLTEANTSEPAATHAPSPPHKLQKIGKPSMQTETIRQLPEYAALTRARKKIMWPLSIAVIVAYFALILAIAFEPAMLGNPIGNGVTSIGMVLGLGIILFCMVITGIYVYYANRVLEPLTQAIIKKAGGKV